MDELSRTAADAALEAHADYLETEKRYLLGMFVPETITLVVGFANIWWGPWIPVTVVVTIVGVVLLVAAVRSAIRMRRYQRFRRG